MRSFLCILTVGFLTFSTLGIVRAQPHENLQVLPRDISQDSRVGRTRAASTVMSARRLGTLRSRL